jgi:hypothetical protein
MAWPKASAPLKRVAAALATKTTQRKSAILAASHYAGLRMNRRSFLASSGVTLADQLVARATPAWTAKRAAEKVHYVLRIAPCKLEIAPGIVIDTIGYNGQVPDLSSVCAKASRSRST